MKTSNMLLIIAFFITISTGCTTVTSHTESPIQPPEPVGREASTFNDFRDLQYKVNKRLIVDEYKAHAFKNPEWDDQAVDFLEKVTKKLSGKGGMSYRKMAEQGEALVELGCNDPMVLNYYALGLNKIHRDRDARKIIAQSIEGLKNSQYPPNQMMFASLRMIIVLMELKDKDAMPEYRDMNTRAIMDVLVSGIYLPGEERVMYRHVEHSLKTMYTQFMEPMLKVADQLETLENADPWTRDMLLGYFHIKRAWNLRSGKKAKDVSPAGWEGFRTHLARAYTHLNAAHHRKPMYPEAATMLITVAMGGGTPGNENPSYWFEKAVNAQLDHVDAYKRLLYALLPKWGGSYDQIMTHAQAWLDTGRFDTEVPYQYLEAVRKICRDRNDYRLLRRPGVYEGLEQMCKGYMENTRSTKKQNYQKSIWAAAAWRAEKNELARKLLQELGSDVDTKGLDQLDVTVKDIVQGF